MIFETPAHVCEATIYGNRRENNERRRARIQCCRTEAPLKLKYKDLAMAPGEPGAPLREARFIMQAKVAHEARRLGIIMGVATVVMAVATMVMAVK
jgi:hypothetical protein